MASECRVCGNCCQADDDGRCAGAYEGECHLNNPPPDREPTTEERIAALEVEVARLRGALREELEAVVVDVESLCTGMDEGQTRAYVDGLVRVRRMRAALEAASGGGAGA